MKRHRNHKRRHKRNKKGVSLKWSALWIGIHAISLFLVWMALEALNVTHALWYVLLTGLGVTLIAKVVRMYTRKKRFKLDEYFFFWSVANAFTIWIAGLIWAALGITNLLALMLLTGLALVAASYAIMQTRPRRNQRVFAAIAMLLIIIFFTWLRWLL